MKTSWQKDEEKEEEDEEEKEEEKEEEEKTRRMLFFYAYLISKESPLILFMYHNSLLRVSFIQRFFT